MPPRKKRSHAAAALAAGFLSVGRLATLMAGLAAMPFYAILAKASRRPGRVLPTRVRALVDQAATANAPTDRLYLAFMVPCIDWVSKTAGAPSVQLAAQVYSEAYQVAAQAAGIDLLASYVATFHGDTTYFLEAGVQVPAATNHQGGPPSGPSGSVSGALNGPAPPPLPLTPAPYTRAAKLPPPPGRASAARRCGPSASSSCRATTGSKRTTPTT